MAVRLTNKDKEKLRRINNNVRRKNKQMDNLGIGDIYHIETLPISQVTSRKQLNDYYDNARRYTRGYGFKFKKNAYGVVASYRELAQAKRLAQEVTKQRQKRLMKIAAEEFKTRGKPTGSSIMQRKLMGDSRYDMYDPVKFYFGSLRNREQFENRVESLANQLNPEYITKKNEQLRENLKKAIDKNWGKDGQKVKDYIDSLSLDEVVKEFMSEDIFDFSYIYDKNKVKRQIEIFEATYNL